MDKQVASVVHVRGNRTVAIYTVLSSEFLNGIEAEWRTPEGRYEVRLSKAEAS